MPFACTICEEESTRICVWCTKDTCGNHLCEKCGRCSDCCECEVPLTGHVHETAPAHAAFAEPAPEIPLEPAAWLVTAQQPDSAAPADGEGRQPAMDSGPAATEPESLGALGPEAVEVLDSEALAAGEPEELAASEPEAPAAPEPEL